MGLIATCTMADPDLDIRFEVSEMLAKTRPSPTGPGSRWLASLAPILLLAFACRGVQDESRFAPKLLQDTAEIEAYVESFPAHEYRIYQVDQVGSFYLDERPEWVKRVLRPGFRWPDQSRFGR